MPSPTKHYCPIGAAKHAHRRFYQLAGRLMLAGVIATYSPTGMTSGTAPGDTATASIMSTKPAGSAATTTTSSAALPPGVDKKTGFRMGRYRSPTPDTLPGGTVVDDTWMRQAATGKRFALVDVFPPKGLGPDPLDGSWRHSEKRASISGATWLPEVGRGHLEQQAIDYLARNLQHLTNGKMDKPLVFFCTADCWQGWNAARRAILMGYTAVHWYPNGTDGWLETGGQVVPVAPVNFLKP